MLWAWAKRRHRNKPSKWVRNKYFRRDGHWTLTDGTAQLYRHNATSIIRFIKVAGRSTPMNPEQRDYWERRKRRNVALETFRRGRLAMLRAQANACGFCGITFWPGDQIVTNHLPPRQVGGCSEKGNRMLAHSWCVPTSAPP